MAVLMKRLSFRYLALVAVLCLAAGCSTPPIPGGDFSTMANSAQTILDCTTETYSRVIKFARYESVAKAQINPRHPKPFKYINLNYQKNSPLFVLYYRERLLKALVKYYNALLKLASDDLATGVVGAMNGLNSGLSSIMGAIKVSAKYSADWTRATNVKNLISMIIGLVAKEYINHLRFNALKKIMEQAEKGDPSQDHNQTIDTWSLLVAGDHPESQIDCEKLLKSEDIKPINCTRSYNEHKVSKIKCNIKYTRNRFVQRFNDWFKVIINKFSERTMRPKNSNRWQLFNIDKQMTFVIDEAIQVNYALRIIARAIKLLACAHHEVLVSLKKKPEIPDDPELDFSEGDPRQTTDQKPEAPKKKSTPKKPTCLDRLRQEVQLLDNIYRGLK